MPLKLLKRNWVRKCFLKLILSLVNLHVFKSLKRLLIDKLNAMYSIVPLKGLKKNWVKILLLKKIKNFIKPNFMFIILAYSQIISQKTILGGIIVYV